MALPTITSRPEKTIDSVLSQWNAANLPLIYDVTNTKWPVNSESSTTAITSVSDSSGFARLNHGSSTGILPKEWVKVTGTTLYDGVHQVRSISGNNLVINFPFSITKTGTSQQYFQNYTTIVRVYAGINPTHEFAASKPIELIGSIEQRPDSNNITLVDVRDYIKNKLNTDYDENIAGWPNDFNGWTDFYISFAERFDNVIAGTVGDFTSAFTNDTTGGNIIYLKAVQGSLQFGDARGGNMYDYTTFNPLNFASSVGGAKFMTFFDRPKIYDCNNFNLSIIINGNDAYPDLSITRLKVTEFDSSGDQLKITVTAVKRQDYGLYRIDLDGLLFQTNTNYIELVLLDSAAFELSEVKTIDIDIDCGDCRSGEIPVGESNWLLEDSQSFELEDGSGHWLLE